MYKIKVFEEEFLFEWENDLILTLINIKKYWEEQKNFIIWNILMQLDYKLKKIIKTSDWLIKILKLLDERKSLLFLSKIGDNLYKIIDNSQNLAEILARFSSNKWYKTQIIYHLRERWLKYLIRNSEDFINTVSWLYWNAENKIFELLEYSFIDKLFSNSKDISKVLYYLTYKNKKLFIEILWYEKIKNTIFHFYDLSSLIKIFPEDIWIEFLEFIWKERILELFEFEKDFYDFLLSLPKSKEKIFLNFLKK